MKTINLLELFGGIGAPRKALENLGYTVNSVGYVENDTNPVKAYNAIYNEDYEPTSVLDYSYNNEQEVDLLVHGSPCQDFSMAGKNDMNSGRSILYNRTLEIIEEMEVKPKYIIWENVKSLLFKNNVEHFNHYLKSMENLGYTNYYEVVNSLEFGTPQERNRVFTISIRNDLNQTFNFDNLEKKPYFNLYDMLETTFDKRYKAKAPHHRLSILNRKSGVLFTETFTCTTKESRRNNSGYVFQDRKLMESFNLQGKHRNQMIVDLVKDYNFEDTFRILMPIETWQLMMFDKEDYLKAKEVLTSESALYKLAGNSIVVGVLEAIFKELLKGEQ